MLQLLGRLFWAYMYTSVLPARHPLEEGTFYLGWDHSNIHQQGIAHLSMARCKHSYSRQIPPPICWPRLHAPPYKNLIAVADGLHKHFACSSRSPYSLLTRQALGWSLLLQDLSDCTGLPHAGRFITLKSTQLICFFLSKVGSG